MKNISELFLDTNILVHLTLTDFDAKKHREASGVVSRLFAQKVRLSISDQVLREFMAVVTNARFLKKPLSSTEAVSQVNIFRDTFTVRESDGEALDVCLRLVAEHGVTGALVHDAAIAATAIRHGVTHLMTYNTSDFKSFKDITSVVPGDL